MFDDIKADLARCSRRGEILLNPALWAVMSYRFSRWNYKSAFPTLVRLPVWLVSIILDLIVRMVLHVELPATADIGPGLYLPHTGFIVVGPTARIGKNCTIAHGVTIGRGGGGKAEDIGFASIGDRVFIGPGVVLLGAIEIGDDALIAAGAVVVRSVPPAGVIAGNPGRLISQKGSFDLISYANMESDPERNAALALFRLESR